MTAPLRVLIVEDSADDAELVLRRLARSGLDVTSTRVEDAAALTDSLDQCEWDIVLADYNLPGFSGLEALRMIRDRCMDVPLVLVSGVIDLPTALAAMKAGARDFVLKNDMERLPSVVEREVAEAQQRRDRRAAELERDRALAELQEANEQLGTFARLTDVPLRGKTLAEVLDDLLNRLVTALGADGATILLLDEDGRLVTRSAIGPAAGIDGHIHIGQGFSGTIAAENRPVYVADVTKDESVLQGIRDSGIRSMLGVPMHYMGKVVGVLHADWVEVFQPPAWEVPLLEIAADRCAVAIENARTYEHEHTVSETLQRALLSDITTVPGLEIGHFYGSATVETLVGGDFFDVFETAPGHVAFSIGDVSGKGLGAAAVTSLAKNVMRALIIEGHAPDIVMGKSNDVIARFTDVETFVTGFYGDLDTATGDLEYCNAGHPPALVAGPLGPRLLETGGPILGALAGAAYHRGSTRIEAGESLILYTDGLTEARSPAGEFYGERRLASFVAGNTQTTPQDLATSLFEEVWAFSQGKLRDDVAVLVLRLRP
jgi:FixJ family two-component response regulator/putative methionine-R-sulfoxide reductase with GAF domain